MRRSPAQEVMDAARGDPEGHRRSAAWEAYSALQAETNRQGWDPPGPPSPFAIESRGYGPVTFRVGDVRPWLGVVGIESEYVANPARTRFHEASPVVTPADPGPNTKRKG